MSLFNELKRRNVFKVAAAYGIVSWLLVQVSDSLVPALRLPEWFNSGVAFVLIIGFPIAMKVMSTDISHKSDAGGVRLNINSASEVRGAYRQMID